MSLCIVPKTAVWGVTQRSTDKKLRELPPRHRCPHVPRSVSHIDDMPYLSTYLWSDPTLRNDVTLGGAAQGDRSGGLFCAKNILPENISPGNPPMSWSFNFLPFNRRLERMTNVRGVAWYLTGASYHSRWPCMRTEVLTIDWASRRWTSGFWLHVS